MANNKPVRVAIMGASGRMGRMLVQAVADAQSVTLAGAFVREGSPFIGMDAGQMAGMGRIGVEISTLDLTAHQADVLIDFSLPQALPAVLEACKKTNTALVLGVTGFSDDDELSIKQASQTLPIVYAGNYSTGVNLSLNLLATTAKTLGLCADVEIIESHHKYKKDAPSGTALMMANAVAAARGQSSDCFVFGREGIDTRQEGDIGIHAVRGGEIVGEHTVQFIMNGEIVEITHKAFSRHVFATGAVKAGVWLSTQNAGLYDMGDVLGLKNSLKS